MDCYRCCPYRDDAALGTLQQQGYHAQLLPFEAATTGTLLIPKGGHPALPGASMTLGSADVG
jgi:hypothetical protein